MTNTSFFYGDDRPDDMVPGDYLKTIMNTFKETSSTSFKVQRLQNGLATNSVAEEWFDGLDAATKGDWDLVEVAFKVRWPRQVLVAQTTEQRRQRLRSERLTKEDIGVMVFSNGADRSGPLGKQDTVPRCVGRGSDGGVDPFSEGEHAPAHEEAREGFVRFMAEILHGGEGNQRRGD
jgi:hypothetical protein